MNGAIISAALAAIGGILGKMLLGVLSNPAFLEKAFIMIAEKIAAHTSTDLDDKMVQLAKDVLAAKAKPEVK